MLNTVKRSKRELPERVNITNMPSNLFIPLAYSHTPADPTGTLVRAGVALMAIASLVGIGTKFIRIPYTVALVVAGLAIAISGTHIAGAHVTEGLVVMLFLPPLLFQAGLHLNLADLRRHWIPVSILAVPGVLLTTVGAAMAIRCILPRALSIEHANWTVALVLGAIVAPTDPISVLSVFRQLGIPHRLRVLIEGESLFNDGTAAALFLVLKASLVSALANGAAAALPDLSTVIVEFIRVTGLGASIGVGLGFAAFWILKSLNDHTLETGITIALAWGAFVVAEEAHASGVMSVIAAGLLIGNYGKTLAMSNETRITLTGFWDSIDFVVNSVVFLLVGLELGAPEIGGWRHLTDPAVLWGAAAVLGALLITRGALIPFIYWSDRDSWLNGWKRVVWWAGLRGGLSLALALGLPAGPVRDYLLPVVFLVVLGTLLVQATTMPIFVTRSPRAAPAEPTGH